MARQCYECGFKGCGWRRRWVKESILYVHYCPKCNMPRRLPRVGPILD